MIREFADQSNRVGSLGWGSETGRGCSGSHTGAFGLESGGIGRMKESRFQFIERTLNHVERECGDSQCQEEPGPRIPVTDPVIEGNGLQQ